jgi:hypothetical protein
MKLSTDDAEFLAFAKRATAGLNDAGLMIGLYDERGRGTLQWFAFALQIGCSLLDAKPLILVVPTGTELPDKLRAAASAVEFYTLGDLASCERATKRGLEACGRPVRH